MASFNKEGDQLNLSKGNEISSKSILKTMENLTKSVQELQKLLKSQMLMPRHENLSEDFEKTQISKTQSASALLKEIEEAMESTIEKLTITEKIYKSEKPDVKEEEETEENLKENLTISERWRIYTELVQKKHEAAKDYCIEKMKFGQELGLTFQETRREMIIGLWSNRLCMILYLKQHNNMNELLKDIEEFEKIEKARSDVFRKHRIRNNK